MSAAPEPDVEPALDAYSRIVTAVAAEVTPHVAALQVTGRDGRGGAGSAVVVTGDGLLLTNAHVVGQAHRGRAVFTDGSETDVDVVGADPLSDLAVVRARGATPPPAVLGNAEDAAGGAARRRRRQPARAGRLGHRRRGQRARPLAARPGTAGRRGWSRTSSRPTPRSTRATPAARSPTRRPGSSASTPRWPAGVSASPSR